MNKEISIQVENLKCGGCANTIKKGLTSLDGIEKVSIDVEKSEILMSMNDVSDVSLALQKLSRMGYPQVGDSNSILKKAKSFVSCAVGKINNEE